MNDLIKYITSNNLGDYKENVSFKTLTTYRTGGIAKLVFYPSTIEALKQAITYIKNKKIPYNLS